MARAGARFALLAWVAALPHALGIRDSLEADFVSVTPDPPKEFEQAGKQQSKTESDMEPVEMKASTRRHAVSKHKKPEADKDGQPGQRSETAEPPRNSRPRATSEPDAHSPLRDYETLRPDSQLLKDASDAVRRHRTDIAVLEATLQKQAKRQKKLDPAREGEVTDKCCCKVAMDERGRIQVGPKGPKPDTCELLSHEELAVDHYAADEEGEGLASRHCPNSKGYYHPGHFDGFDDGRNLPAKCFPKVEHEYYEGDEVEVKSDQDKWVRARITKVLSEDEEFEYVYDELWTPKTGRWSRRDFPNGMRKVPAVSAEPGEKILVWSQADVRLKLHDVVHVLKSFSDDDDEEPEELREGDLGTVIEVGERSAAVVFVLKPRDKSKIRIKRENWDRLRVQIKHDDEEDHDYKNEEWHWVRGREVRGRWVTGLVGEVKHVGAHDWAFVQIFSGGGRDRWVRLDDHSQVRPWNSPHMLTVFEEFRKGGRVPEAPKPNKKELARDALRSAVEAQIWQDPGRLKQQLVGAIVMGWRAGLEDGDDDMTAAIDVLLNEEVLRGGAQLLEEERSKFLSELQQERLSRRSSFKTVEELRRQDYQPLPEDYVKARVQEIANEQVYQQWLEEYLHEQMKLDEDREGEFARAGREQYLQEIPMTLRADDKRKYAWKYVNTPELWQQEFNVTLTRRKERGRVSVGWRKALGIDVRVQGEAREVRVKEILPGGVVAAHNAKYPKGKMVFEGDVIRAVNEQREGSDKLLKLLDETSDRVTLTLAHQASATGETTDEKPREPPVQPKPNTKVTKKEKDEQRAVAMGELEAAMARPRWIVGRRRPRAEDVARLRRAIQKAEEARFTAWRGEWQATSEGGKTWTGKETKGKKLLSKRDIEPARQLLKKLELNTGHESDFEYSLQSSLPDSWEA